MLKRLSRLLGRTAKAEPAIGLRASDMELVVPMIKAVSEPRPTDAGKVLHLGFDQSPMSRPLAADMLVMYAIDRPTHVEYVSNGALATTGLTLEQLHQRSIENLPARLGKVQLHDCGSGVFGLSAGGTFEASLLLLDDLWRQLAEHLPGEPLAAVPSRDLLFVIGSARPDSAELIAAKARIVLIDDRYAISQSVIKRREGKWQAFAH